MKTFFSFAVLEVDIVPTSEDIYCGQTVQVEIHVKNQSNEDATVKLNIRAQLTQYTGEVIREIDVQENEKRKVRIAKHSGLSNMLIMFREFVHVLRGDP